MANLCLVYFTIKNKQDMQPAALLPEALLPEALPQMAGVAQELLLQKVQALYQVPPAGRWYHWA